MAAAANVGISAHTDFETHTFLHQDSPGLQLWLPAGGGGGGGGWATAPLPDEGHWTCILSDMVERWTNGLAPACRHRVAFTPWPRASLIRFVGVDADTVVAPLPCFGPPRADYPPVSQGAWLDQKMAAADARRLASVERGIVPRSEAAGLL